MSETLTPRWTPLRPHAGQRALLLSTVRFRVVPAGRRSGKTELAKRRLVHAAMTDKSGEGRYFAAAPIRQQAKAIYWDDLKRLIPKYMLASPPRETDLQINLINGAMIQVLGLDVPERIEGVGWDGGILDEYGNMKPTAWGAHVRPTLSDRLGWCWLIGVPEGRNHYYDLYKAAQADLSGEWATFTWHSSGILPQHEIDAARNDLDEMTFRQEYEADFVSFSGGAYYAFSEKVHVHPCQYNNHAKLIFCFDFNISPGVAVVCQEQILHDKGMGTAVIGEVHVPNFSTTEIVCDRLIKDWGSHKGPVHVYGDATGGAQGSAKLAGSDWEIIARKIKAAYGDRYASRVPKANPTERSRVNAVNSRLMTAGGGVRLNIDPKCVNLIKDLEGVRVLDGGSGEIDKKSDKKLTHISDALGYYIVKDYPIVKREIYDANVIGFL